MDFEIHHLPKYTDHRGSLVEFLRTSDLEERNKKFGQIYFVTFDDKNIVRGNHYHLETEEWFGVVFGSLFVMLEDIHTKERKTFNLHYSESEFVRLRIGKEIAHAFKALTKPAILLDYANIQYDPSYTDRQHYHLM